MIFKNKLIQYAYNIFLSLDQLVNVLLGGDPDESLSGRLGRAKMSGKIKWYAKPILILNDSFYLIFGVKDHSLNAVQLEETNDKEIWHWYYDTKS